MRKYTQLREFLVEVTQNSRVRLSNIQILGNNVVALPTTTPRLTRRSDGQLTVRIKVILVDSLETGQRCVTRARLCAHPALILEALLHQILTALDGLLMEHGGQRWFRLVERRITVLIGNRHLGTVMNELVGNRLVAPETCVMQRCVAVLVGRVDVRSVP